MIIHRRKDCHGQSLLGANMRAFKPHTAVTFSASTLCAIAMVGCGNSGGDTACGDFTDQSSKEQKATIQEVLKQKDVKTTGFLAGAKIAAGRVAAAAYCSGASTDSTLNDGIDSIVGGAN